MHSAVFRKVGHAFSLALNMVNGARLVLRQTER